MDLEQKQKCMEKIKEKEKKREKKKNNGKNSNLSLAKVFDTVLHIVFKL